MLLSADLIFSEMVLFKLEGTCSSGNSVIVKEQYFERRFEYSDIASFRYFSFNLPYTNYIYM